MIALLVALTIAYLLGSLNSAMITCKLMKLPDPREGGSGNPGATNVMRLGGKKAGAIVLIGDMLKGFIPVIIGLLFGLQGFALGLVALAAVIGHMYPIFFNFLGGKGVATTLGAILGLSLWIGLFIIIIWFVVVAVTRYVSLASICAVVAAPLLALGFGHFGYFVTLTAIAALVVYRHLENIKRLRSGIENKINFK